jgi:hypothetical protein
MMAFGGNTAVTPRDAMAGDLQRLATMAQGYYHRLEILGGGGGSFSGLKLGLRNPNGTYTLIDVQPGQVVLMGRGKDPGAGGNLLSLRMIVFPDTMMLATRD